MEAGPQRHAHDRAWVLGPELALERQELGKHDVELPLRECREDLDDERVVRVPEQDRESLGADRRPVARQPQAAHRLREGLAARSNPSPLHGGIGDVRVPHSGPSPDLLRLGLSRQPGDDLVHDVPGTPLLPPIQASVSTGRHGTVYATDMPRGRPRRQGVWGEP